jgi:hypothetical protein
MASQHRPAATQRHFVGGSAPLETRDRRQPIPTEDIDRVYHGSVKVACAEEEGKLMTPNQVKTFAAAIDMSRGDEVSARLEEFDALVGNWLIDNSNSISLCSVEHQQSVASPQWMMLSVMVTYWVQVSVQEGEEESRS